MNKAYNRINDGKGWENYPSEKTPLNKHNLDKGDVALDEIDNRVIALDNTKATKVEVSELIKEISYDKKTGIITFTRKNGATVTIDTPMEKIQTGIYYDPETEMLTLPLIDGTTIGVDLSRLITEFEFADSETITFSVSTDGKVSAIVKEGSIQEKHLRPDYLADIKAEEEKARASAASAESSKNAAESAASTAIEKASEASAYAENASESATTATQKAEEASESALEAASVASEAANSATIATGKADESGAFSSNAGKYAGIATDKANAASVSETNAATSATNADNYAKTSQSYAVGTGGVRPNENIDSAKYYYEQSKSISEGLAGALMPIGTVTFANLPPVANAESGWMYNISDQFTTTADFKEGVGNVIPAGANVYKTADGYWDILAGTPVTGIKGNAESTYRQGNVNITPANIGLGSVGDFKAVSTIASQGLTDTEKSNARANIGAGTSSFSGSYNDLSNKPSGKISINDQSGGNAILKEFTGENDVSFTIPFVGNGTLTIKQAGTQKGTFTMNQSGDTTIELTDNNTVYSLPLAASGTRGGVQIGYSANGKNYPVQLSNEKMFVNVPWTDTNTWRGIQNNLNSDSTTESLSAAQGKALKGMVDKTLKCKILSDSISGIVAGGNKNITLATGFSSGYTVVAAIPYLNINTGYILTAYVLSTTLSSIIIRVNNNGNTATTSGNLIVALLYI